LKDFTLEENVTQTFISCSVIYDEYKSTLKPIFLFPIKKLQNIDLISYKLTKTHLSFQVIDQNGIGSGIHFYFNESLDKYSSEGGMS
jgi:hypothetical protein